MVEQDYIMRLIRELVRTLLKLLFNIDTKSITSELLEEEEYKETLNSLLDLIEKGEINKAENILFGIIEDKKDDNKEILKMALLFYSYLNEKNNEFLETNNFDREEIKAGITDVLAEYNLSDMAETFLNNY